MGTYLDKETELEDRVIRLEQRVSDLETVGKPKYGTKHESAALHLPVVVAPVKITKCKSFKIHNPYEVDTKVNEWLSSNKIVIKNVQQTNVKYVPEGRYSDSTSYITLITIFYEDA